MQRSWGTNLLSGYMSGIALLNSMPVVFICLSVKLLSVYPRLWQSSNFNFNGKTKREQWNKKEVS